MDRINLARLIFLCLAMMIRIPAVIVRMGNRYTAIPNNPLRKSDKKRPAVPDCSLKYTANPKKRPSDATRTPATSCVPLFFGATDLVFFFFTIPPQYSIFVSGPGFSCLRPDIIWNGKDSSTYPIISLLDN